MKRCPLCDFIYEDDQSLCDMDGIELVHDRGALVPANAPARGSALAVRSPRKKLSVLPLVAATLGAAAFSAYYLSTGGAAPATGDRPPASVSGQTAPVPVLVPAAPPATPSPNTSSMNEVRGADTVAPPARPSPTPSRPRAAKPKGKKVQSERGGDKKESKLGAFLNKTGRILKKPFKF